QVCPRGILNRRVNVLLVLSLHRFDNVAAFLLYTTEAFGEVAHGQVDHPDLRQADVHAARMADSSYRVSILPKQVVVDVALTPVLHLYGLRSAPNDLSIEILSC